MNLFHKLLLLNDHVCPWWLAFTFDNPVRRLFHDTEKILSPYVNDGMTVIDIGCGMGYFSMGLAELVGERGSVISVDIQQKMLNVLRRRAKRAGFIHRIRLHRCTPNTIGIKQRVDFVLAFWMVHEVPCKKAFFDQVFSILKPNGKYLLAEPKVHVSRVQFAQIISDCMRTGFKVLDDPKISWSRAVLFGKR